jgi:hypothetical protein
MNIKNIVKQNNSAAHTAGFDRNRTNKKNHHHFLLVYCIDENGKERNRN